MEPIDEEMFYFAIDNTHIDWWNVPEPDHPRRVPKYYLWRRLVEAQKRKPTLPFISS